MQTIMGEEEAYFCCPGTLKTDISRELGPVIDSQIIRQVGGWQLLQ